MRCGIEWAGGVACLFVMMIAAAMNGPRLASRTAAAAPCAVPERGGQPGSSPLPTQIWWTDRQGGFIVYESGLGRFTEFDSTSRRRQSIRRRARVVFSDTPLFPPPVGTGRRQSPPGWSCS